jgi:hypothetical protein
MRWIALGLRLPMTTWLWTAWLKELDDGKFLEWGE